MQIKNKVAHLDRTSSAKIKAQLRNLRETGGGPKKPDPVGEDDELATGSVPPMRFTSFVDSQDEEGAKVRVLRDSESQPPKVGPLMAWYKPRERTAETRASQESRASGSGTTEPEPVAGPSQPSHHNPFDTFGMLVNTVIECALM